MCSVRPLFFGRCRQIVVGLGDNSGRTWHVPAGEGFVDIVQKLEHALF